MRIECWSGRPASLDHLLGRLGLAAMRLRRRHLALLLLLSDHLDDALATLNLKDERLLLHRVVHLLLLRLLPDQLLAQDYQVRFR